MKGQAKKTRSQETEKRLLDWLARIAILEEMMEGKRSEASFFALADESYKKDINTLLTESGDHYNMLAECIEGIEKLKAKYEERFLKNPPFNIGGETEREVIENQLSTEKSAVMYYESILKMIDEMAGQKEVRRGTVRIQLEKLRKTVSEIMTQEKRHVKIMEKIYANFKNRHLRDFPTE